MGGFKVLMGKLNASFVIVLVSNIIIHYRGISAVKKYEGFASMGFLQRKPPGPQCIMAIFGITYVEMLDTLCKPQIMSEFTTSASVDQNLVVVIYHKLSHSCLGWQKLDRKISTLMNSVANVAMKTINNFLISWSFS